MKKENQKEEVAKGCVLYVDGGCRVGYPSDPDKKYGGWGIHGYSYEINKKPPQKRTKKDIPTVKGYELGETTQHEEQVVPLEYIDAYGSMTGYDASDRAELTGFKQAIELIKHKGYTKAHLLLDNQYVITGATDGYEKWSSSNWIKSDGKPYANRELWEQTMDTLYPLKSMLDFSISWVNGHSGNLGNDRADYLATKGVYFGRNGLTNNTDILFSPPAKYRDPKPNINRLFVKNRWYFNTSVKEPQMSKDGRYVYHLGAHGSDDTLVGKPMADSVACVLYTKEMEKVLEAVRQHHINLVDNPLNDLCMARLNTLLLPRIYHEIETDGVNVLSLAPRKLRFHGLCTIDEQEVTKLIQPSGLTFKLIEVHNFLNNELDRYLNGQALLTDITSTIYTIKEGKKKVEYRSSIKPSDKVLRLKARYDSKHPDKMLECALTIGIDFPPKELIKAIESRQPKIYLTTWMLSDHAFKYAVIIDCEDDVLIWMGKDSNMQFIYPKELKKAS